MRWENLFDDLEGQLEFELSADERERDVEEERLRVARLTLRERLGAVDRSFPIRCGLGRTECLDVTVTGIGKDWLILETVATQLPGTARVPNGRTLLVPLRSVEWWEFDPNSVDRTVPRARNSGDTGSGAPQIVERISLPFILRDLARRRRLVSVVAGQRVQGTIDRVGADHCDLALHAGDEPRRQKAVRSIRIIPFHTITYIEM
ncbi:MAG: hypothetical protein ACTJHU_08260 [Mycetocola sp.]